MAKRIVRRAGSTKEKSITIGEAFARYMAEGYSKGLSKSTMDNYLISLNKFMAGLELEDDTALNEIDDLKTLIDVWVWKLRTEGSAESSVNHYLRDIRAFLYWCMEKDYLYYFKITIRAAREEQLKLYTDEELNKLLAKPKREEINDFCAWRNHAIVHWVLATGNRVQTICCVKIGDVDFKNKEIVLRHTKNRKAQVLPLSTELARVLKEYIAEWRGGCSDDDFLFCNVSAEELTAGGLKHSFAKYCKKRGVERTSLHSLRHNFAKGYLRAGGNMYKLQQLLGHSTLDMTRKYIKLFSEDLKEDFDNFSPLDNIKKSTTRRKMVTRAK